MPEGSEMALDEQMVRYTLNQKTEEYDENIPFTDMMLRFPWRNYIDRHIKAPLRQVIMAGKSLAEVLKVLKTSVDRMPPLKRGLAPNTKILLDKLELLRGYLHHRGGSGEMIDKAGKMIAGEIQHDPFYAFIFDFLLIEMALELARGNWKPQSLKFIEPKSWSGGDLPDYKTIKKMLKEALDE